MICSYFGDLATEAELLAHLDTLKRLDAATRHTQLNSLDDIWVSQSEPLHAARSLAATSTAPSASRTPPNSSRRMAPVKSRAERDLTRPLCSHPDSIKPSTLWWDEPKILVATRHRFGNNLARPHGPANVRGDECRKRRFWTKTLSPKSIKMCRVLRSQRLRMRRLCSATRVPAFCLLSGTRHA